LERTSRATQEIGEMTQSIQSETQHAVEGMRSGIELPSIPSDLLTLYATPKNLTSRAHSNPKKRVLSAPEGRNRRTQMSEYIHIANF
jgi:hypothetical protein